MKIQSVALLVAIGLIGVTTLAPAQEQPRFGGVLKIATIGEPPTLDRDWTNASLTIEITDHMFEGLFAYDRDFKPIPMLADRYTLTEAGRRYTVGLRQGVRFHNGKVMTATDVVASLQRWGTTSTLGRQRWRNVESVVATDASTVVIQLKQPSSVLLQLLARGYVRIYPKDVIDAAGKGQLKTFVGTGPFRFVEHKPDRHIKLVRFKDYTARPEPPNGQGGQRGAYVDEILFIPVPDVATRMAGVQSGQYHYAMRIKGDQYDRLLGLPGVEPRLQQANWLSAVPNHKRGIMTSRKIRQAVQAALDMEPIMFAAIGHQLLYRVGGSLFEHWPWQSPAGVDAYNQKDKDKARRLMKEGGYAGETLRWLTTNEYEYFYKSALVAKQQLEEVGFTIDLRVMDWATLIQSTRKPELFDVFSMGVIWPGDPALHSGLQCAVPTSGGWCHEEKDRLLADLGREPDVAKRKALLERIQVLYYEDVGQFRFGDQFPLDVVRKELRGEFRGFPGMFFWNAWITSKGASQ